MFDTKAAYTFRCICFFFFKKKIVEKKTVYERTFQTQKYGGALEHNG